MTIIEFRAWIEAICLASIAIPTALCCGVTMLAVARYWWHVKFDSTDAKRYRYLRADSAKSSRPVVYMCDSAAEPNAALFGEQLDVAIDKELL